MQLLPSEWARWTLKQFDLAYAAWREINVHGPWERARAISFYTIVPHSKDTTKWEEVFPLEIDKLRKRRKMKPNNIAYATDMTEEEKALFKQLLPNG